MAQGDTTITIVGNVVNDPELRFTPTGTAVANFRVASTPRSYNRETGQFEDGEALFLTVNVWRQAAENIAESLSKGMRVVVVGRLKQRSYQTKEGDNRTVYEIEADEVAPSLRFASAQVTRNPRNGGDGNYGGGNYGGGQGQGGQAPRGNQGYDNQGYGNQGGFGGQGQNQGGQGQGNQGGFGNQGGQGGQGNQGPVNDPWGSAPPAGGNGGFGGGNDEPPF